MSDYIKREALDKAFTDLRFNQDGTLNHWGDRPDWYLHGQEIEDLINSIPAADVRPNARGEWIEQVVSCVVKGKRYPDYHEYRCSICGANYVDIGYGYNFCPNCGADMRGDNK